MMMVISNSSSWNNYKGFHCFDAPVKQISQTSASSQFEHRHVDWLRYLTANDRIDHKLPSPFTPIEPKTGMTVRIKKMRDLPTKWRASNGAKLWYSLFTLPVRVLHID
jgi:hypothetical protein